MRFLQQIFAFLRGKRLAPKPAKLKIVVVGTGYVGLVSGTCFAALGQQVTCVDRDMGKVARLQQGDIPIYEPGLAKLVKKNVRAGRLHFTTHLPSAVAQADIVFIAVGTPTNPQDGMADLSQVFAAAREVASGLSGYTLIVNKSTVPAGTAQQVEAIIRAAQPQADFDVSSNPEFLREGAAIGDFMRPDRIVVGHNSARAAACMAQLYQPLAKAGVPVLYTTREAAELIKYASNAFLAMKISFINEIANICEKMDANVQDIARGMGLDKRIGAQFLQAGPGYGGSCFPKDTAALATTARHAGAPMQLVEATIRSNQQRKQALATRVIEAMGGAVRGRKVAILGVAFKPGTDDMRDSPALDLIPALQAAGAHVHAYDPAAMASAAKLLPRVVWGQSAEEVCQNAHMVVLLTEWPEFRALDLVHMAKSMATPAMVDFRAIFAPAEMAAHGFVYHSVGRPAYAPATPYAHPEMQLSAMRLSDI